MAGIKAEIIDECKTRLKLCRQLLADEHVEQAQQLRLDVEADIELVRTWQAFEAILREVEDRV